MDEYEDSTYVLVRFDPESLRVGTRWPAGTVLSVQTFEDGTKLVTLSNEEFPAYTHQTNAR